MVYFILYKYLLYNLSLTELDLRLEHLQSAKQLG
jgi:hypothetical protein